MSATLTYQDVLTTMQCGKCGIHFAMPELVRLERQNNGGDFYCPNGHCRVYRESDVDSLKKQLVAEQARRQQAEAQRIEAERQRAIAEQQSRATKKKLGATMKRVECGVCPHCQRTFKQLAAHMKSKHAVLVNA